MQTQSTSSPRPCARCSETIPDTRPRGRYCSDVCAFNVPRGAPAEQRFWAKVHKTDTCWVWTGALGPRYGAFAAVPPRHVPAHRYSWELHYGPIPDGLRVLHRCDFPPCVRPDHLFLGTQADNVHDMMRKGRNSARVKPESLVRGEQHGMAKLTEVLVREIRERVANGERQYRVAQAYRVSGATVSLIVNGHIWKEVVTPPCVSPAVSSTSTHDPANEARRL